MKKVFFLLAVAAMFSFAACGNNGKAEATDTTVAEETAIVEEAAAEEVATDSTVVEAAAEEVATEAAAE